MLLRDLRYSLRMLVKNPAFAFVIVCTLALGIGANTAMFSIVNTILLQNLPFKNAERLVSIWSATRPGQRAGTALPDYREVRRRSHSFEALAAYTRRAVNVTGKQDPERLRILLVSPEFLSVLGIQPRLGRDFLPQEGEWGAPHVAIITDRMWRRSFAADPGVLGRSIHLDGEAYSIIGILPPDFWFLDLNDQLLAPLSVPPAFDNRGNHFLSLIGRLRPDVTRDNAAADLAAAANAINQEFALNNAVGFDLGFLREDVVQNVRTALLVLMAAIGLVLLIACGNLASLLLARAVARRKETAIRRALGASTGVLFRQFMMESILLAGMGGMAGVFLAYFSVRLIRLLSPSTLPRATQIHIDAPVLLFTFGVSLLTGLIFAGIPVLQASRVNVNETLKAGGHSSRATGQYHARAALVVAEVALAMLLLAGAGLMIRSLHLLRAVDSGFDENNVLIFGVNLPEDTYLDAELSKGFPFPAATERASLFLQQAMDRIAQLNGVRAVGATTTLPLSGVSWDKVVTFFDRPLPSSVEKLPPIEYRPVAGDYFRAMGIRLIQGRVFDAHDNLQSRPVTVVNQELVRRYMNGQNPLGKVLAVNPPRALLPRSAVAADYPQEPEKFTIVGVVGDARYASLVQQAGPMVYVPYSQNAEAMLSISFAVRTDADPMAIEAAVRRQMAEIDKDLPLGPMATMEQEVSDEIGRPRIEMFVLSIFSGLALLLSGVGVYGVISYSVAQRTQEIGIRMALGARLIDVTRMVLGQGMLLVFLGLAIGLTGALVLTRLMKSMVYGTGMNDTPVFLISGLVLAFTALVAIYFPARRATRINPQSALRTE